MLDALGHLAYVFLVWGTFRVARGHPTGFAWRVAGSLLWLWLGIELSLTSVWFWSGIFAAIDSYGLYRATHPPRGIR